MRTKPAPKVEESALVERGRWLVDADSDELHSVYTGPIWTKRSSTPAFQQHFPMAFYVDEHGDLHFLEPLGRTWSDVVARKAKKVQAR